MTLDEKRVIRGFAAGRQDFMESALASFRRELRRNGTNMRGDPFFDFMSEVDSPSPDLVLRNMYREKILAK